MEEQFAERVPACRKGRRFDPDQVHQFFSNCLCKWKSSLRSASRLAGKVVGSIPTRSTKFFLIAYVNGRAVCRARPGLPERSSVRSRPGPPTFFLLLM